MSFFQYPIPQSKPLDTWPSQGQISITHLKSVYPALENGDWILKQTQNCWELYKPASSAAYDLYKFGFIGNKESPFYFQKKIDQPILIKPSNRELMAIVMKQLNSL